MRALALLEALLGLLGPLRADARACVEGHRPELAAEAQAAADAHGVPVAEVLVVGALESLLGCDPGGRGSWGAPGGREGAADRTASALARGHRRCATTAGAIACFRCNACRCPRRHLRGYSPAYAARLIERVEAAARPTTPTTRRSSP